MNMKRLLADALIAAALITAVAVARTVEARKADQETRTTKVTNRAAGAELMPRADRFACMHGIQPGCKRREQPSE